MQASYLHHSQAESDSGGGEFYLSEMPYNAKVLAQTICPEHQITGFK
jgi:hypothetical protein